MIKINKMINKYFILCLTLVMIFNFEPKSSGKILTDEVLFPQTHKLYFQAKEYYIRGDLEKAQKELEQILKIDPADKVAQEFLKIVSSDIKEQIQKNEDFLTHYKLAQKYQKAKNWEDAQKELKTAVEVYPQHPDASEAIALWEKINRLIIKEAKEKTQVEVEKETEAVRKQDMKLAELKLEKEEEPARVVEKDGVISLLKPEEKPATEDKKSEPEKTMVNLSDCVQIAVLNSIPIKIAKEYVELSEMKLFESWRVLFPSVTGEIHDTYGKTEEGDYESQKRILQLQQLVFDGGRSIFRLHQAELDQKIAQQNFLAEKQELIFEVEKTYYSLIHFQNVVKIQKDLYQKTREYFDLTTQQYQSGYVSRVEYLNLESKFNQVGYDLVSQQQALALSKLKFQQVLNLDTPFALEIESVVNYNPDLVIDIDRCLALALRNRPEIRVAQLSLASSKYGEKIAKRKAWPELNILGHIGESGEAYTDDVLRMRDEWSVLAKLSWSFGGSTLDYSYGKEKDNPTEIAEVSLTTEARTHSLKFGLLDDLEYYSKGKEAEIAFQKAMNNYNELRQKIIMDVKEAYFTYERTKIMLEAIKSKLKYHNKEVEIAELRRSLDIIPLSNLVEARVLLSEQQVSYSRALLEHQQALAALNRALGISFYYTSSDKKKK